LPRAYYLLDVFTQHPLSGNPLAVVLDSEGLDAQHMQAIAREFNLSETVFILPPHDPVNTARLRIFTPTGELPFAGHPTIGSAALLASLRAGDLIGTRDVLVVLEEIVGTVHCTVRRVKGEGIRASFVLPQLPEEIGAPSASDLIARALGLEEADIGFVGHQPSVFSAGLPFTYVPVAGLATIARAAPVYPLFDTIFGAHRPAVFVYTGDTADAKHTFHARMFGSGLGVHEDPATGSAAAGFAGVLMQFQALADGDHTILIEQGYEMGRPSLITLGLDISGGVLTEASIGGFAVVTARGTLDL
jgi:trans-2,3-dihydro-3-hydroxyanthranilate isomerase